MTLVVLTLLKTLINATFHLFLFAVLSSHLKVKSVKSEVLKSKVFVSIVIVSFAASKR